MWLQKSTATLPIISKIYPNLNLTYLLVQLWTTPSSAVIFVALCICDFTIDPRVIYSVTARELWCVPQWHSLHSPPILFAIFGSLRHCSFDTTEGIQLTSQMQNAICQNGTLQECTKNSNLYTHVLCAELQNLSYMQSYCLYISMRQTGFFCSLL